VEETVKALTPEESDTLQTTYAADLSKVIAKIIQLLVTRGLIFSAGKLGKHRYYGVVGIIDPATPSLPTEQSRRQRVFELVRRAVNKLGRAVRVSDVVDYAAESMDGGNLTAAEITHDVLSLKEMGELILVGSVRGDGKGINLYLPADLNPEDYLPTEPLTWLEAVAQVFNELWTESVKRAGADDRKPRPITTGQVRELLKAKGQYAKEISNPLTLVSAMQQLAESNNPTIRKIKRPKLKAILWVPPDIKDEDVDTGDAYATDTERIREAVRRAESSLARPVSVRDVQDQIEIHPHLAPAGTCTLHSILSDISKETVAAGGERHQRAEQHVYRIGKIAGTAYYSTDRSPEAAAFVEFGRLELSWKSMRIDEQLNGIETCALPSVAIGRAMLAATETESVILALDHLCAAGHLVSESKHRADELREHTVEALRSARDWLDRFNPIRLRLPESVKIEVPGWTADELLKVVKPLYPRSQKITDASKLTSLMDGDIRRIPNPEYINRFSDDPRKASEYLYDRTDALLFIAKQWGQFECCLQATLASNELGRLRDARFIFPALRMKDYNARLAAVACLAFLPSDAGNLHLRRIAVDDSDPGVRQSALWAYGFAGATDAHELLDRSSRDDPHMQVRNFAHEVLLNSQESWWSI
jgi:hypothetical protein